MGRSMLCAPLRSFRARSGRLVGAKHAGQDQYYSEPSLHACFAPTRSCAERTKNRQMEFPNAFIRKYKDRPMTMMSIRIPEDVKGIPSPEIAIMRVRGEVERPHSMTIAARDFPMMISNKLEKNSKPNILDSKCPRLTWKRFAVIRRGKWPLRAVSLDMLKSEANLVKLSVAPTIDWKKKHRISSEIIERVTTGIYLLCILIRAKYLI